MFLFTTNRTMMLTFIILLQQQKSR